MSDNRSEESNFVELYYCIGNCYRPVDAERTVPDRHPLPDDWEGAKVIPFPRSEETVPHEGRFDFLRGAEIRSVIRASDGGDNLELRLVTAISADGRSAFAVAARACRVVWTTSQGATWVQKVRGVTVSSKDARVVTLRLKARRLLDVEVVRRVPPSGDILVTSEDETVTTDSFRLGLIRVS